MPFLKKTVYAGNVIEVTKYHSYRYQSKSRPRSKNREVSKETVRRQNDKNSTLSLGYQINLNFNDDDYHLVLTYKKDCRPNSWEECSRDLEKFMKDVRKIYKQQEIEFKYVTVTGGDGPSTYHHHIIFKSIDIRLLRSLWTKGMIRANFLYTHGDYKFLAEYFTGHTIKHVADPNHPLKKRYNSSKNLKKPKIKREIIKSSTWQNEPKPVKGYYIIKDSLNDGFSGITGYPYMSYRMKKIE